MKKLELNSNNKYLLFADSKGLSQIQSQIKELKLNQITHNLFKMDSILDEDKITNWLSKQKLMTILYISAEVKTARKVSQIAQKIGFTSDSIHVHIVSEQIYQIFCSQCHKINPAHSIDPLKCKRCQVEIEPSDHYSSYYDAYLGYPILKKEGFQS